MKVKTEEKYFTLELKTSKCLQTFYTTYTQERKGDQPANGLSTQQQQQNDYDNINDNNTGIKYGKSHYKQQTSNRYRLPLALH